MNEGMVRRSSPNPGELRALSGLSPLGAGWGALGVGCAQVQFSEPETDNLSALRQPLPPLFSLPPGVHGRKTLVPLFGFLLFSSL